MDQNPIMAEDVEPILFEAEFPPYRSLSRRGITIAISVLAALSLGITTMFWVLGAWPVAGFSGVEVGLVLFLLLRNARGAMAMETLVLTRRSMMVERARPGGRRSRLILPAAWLGHRLEEAPGRVPRLFLTSRRRQFEVAQSLGEAEKRDLAEALDRALHRLRHPVFDNPQLREGP
jgi:uncharacterized membrane protein